MRLAFYIFSLLFTISINAQNCCEFKFVKGESIEQLRVMNTKCLKLLEIKIVAEIMAVV